MEYYSDCAKNYSVSERLNNTEKNLLLLNGVFSLILNLIMFLFIQFHSKFKLHANLTFVYTEGKYRII